MPGYSDCIFCKIAAKEIPASVLYEDNGIIAIADINPVAPVHILIIPKEHISSLLEINENHQVLLGKMQLMAAKLANEAGISDSGCRLVCNCGEDGGQTVSHLHYHLLGGRKMQWPPG